MTEREEVRTVSFGIYPKMWNEFDVAVRREFAWKKDRTDVLKELLQSYIQTNSEFLWPEGPERRMSAETIEAERQKISSVVNELTNELGKKRKTTVLVPLSLWKDLHIVVGRKFIAHRTDLNDVITMLISNYLRGDQQPSVATNVIVVAHGPATVMIDRREIYREFIRWYPGDTFEEALYNAISEAKVHRPSLYYQVV